jgi:hypothetical protein
MKYLKANFILTLIIFLSFTQPVSAQLGTLAPPPAANGNITETIFKFINFALGSGLAVFGLLFMWACIKWIMSEGDKQGLAQARARITSAIIGLLLLGVSFAIFNIVKIVTYDPAAGPAGSPPPGTDPIECGQGGITNQAVCDQLGLTCVNEGFYSYCR